LTINVFSQSFSSHYYLSSSLPAGFGLLCCFVALAVAAAMERRLLGSKQANLGHMERRLLESKQANLSWP
jgi:hypothetical protein